VFWVISVYFNIRNTLPKSGTFLLGHPVYDEHDGTSSRRFTLSTGLDSLPLNYYTTGLIETVCVFEHSMPFNVQNCNHGVNVETFLIPML